MRSLNRGLIWTVLPSLPIDFPSINQAVKWLQRQGKGYHYQTMWHDVSSAFQAHKKAPLQRAVAVNEYIPQELFIEKDWKRPQSYYYYGNIYKQDPDTKEVFRTTYSFYSETSLNEIELTESAYQIEAEKLIGTPPFGDVIRFERMQSFHKWGAPRSEGYRIAEI